MIRITYYSTLFCLITSPAFAHAGHLGELAGHAHWLGLGAAVAAGALAAILAKQKGKRSEDKEESATEESAAEGEAA